MENKVKIKELPSLEFLQNRFEIDSNSPSGLKFGRGSRLYGRSAGTKTKGGYFRVRIDGSPYFVHRIIYALSRGTSDLQNLYIDHIDRNPSNNHPDNLRLVTPSENNLNRDPESFSLKSRKLQVNNKSGVNNIFFHGRDKYWVVQWRVNKRKNFKSFKTFEEAKNWSESRISSEPPTN